jgi:all-trans-8'-apo-beta-carotenal 15,15'-oxygenase
MTPRHLIFMLMPFDLNPGEGPFFELMRFAPQRACRVAVIPKDALEAPRWFECEFAMAYHFGDAHERGEEIFMRTVRHRNIEDARSPMAAAMRGERGDTVSGTDLATLRLNLRTGTARWERHEVADIEFPTFDERTPGDTPARLFAPCGVGQADAPYFNGVMSVDVERGRTQRWGYGRRVMAEEHRFVPKPGGRVGEGWLLGTLLDYGRGRSGLALLDAERVAEGPLAMAWVPYTTPLGFHGWFSPHQG